MIMQKHYQKLFAMKLGIETKHMHSYFNTFAFTFYMLLSAKYFVSEYVN